MLTVLPLAPWWDTSWAGGRVMFEQFSSLMLWDDKLHLPRGGGVPCAQIVEKFSVEYVHVQMEGGKCGSQPSTSVCNHVFNSVPHETLHRALDNLDRMTSSPQQKMLNTGR